MGAKRSAIARTAAAMTQRELTLEVCMIDSQCTCSIGKQASTKRGWHSWLPYEGTGRLLSGHAAFRDRGGRRKFHKFANEVGGMKLYVNRGIGSVGVPFRFD